MKSKSRPKRSSVKSARAAPCPSLPPEITEICLRIYAQRERESLCGTSLKNIGLLRLVSRRFRDIFTKELFNSVTLCLASIQGRPAAFIDILRMNNDILKHIRHVTIRLSAWQNRLASTDVDQACKVVRVFSQAPLRTLTIEGLDKEFEHSAIFNALHTLRSVRSLQTLNISGSAIPPFLVCGHFASTRLKSIQFPLCFSSPDELTGDNFLSQPGLSIGPDSILASGFQLFADVQDLCFPNGADVPKYFPLQDFGSTYYPSNGRIPFTLPALRKLRIGDPERWGDGVRLGAEDYKVLGALLSRAPRLETLRISDEFWRHGLDTFAPLVDQLPSLKNLRLLELVDVNDFKRGEPIVAISSLLSALPSPTALETLIIQFEWRARSIDVTRASLYFSEAWQKLQRALVNPALESLQVLVLDITITISNTPHVREETLGPEEVEAFKEELFDLYSRDGELDVTIEVAVELW